MFVTSGHGWTSNYKMRDGFCFKVYDLNKEFTPQELWVEVIHLKTAQGTGM